MAYIPLSKAWVVQDASVGIFTLLLSEYVIYFIHADSSQAGCNTDLVETTEGLKPPNLPGLPHATDLMPYLVNGNYRAIKG